MPASVHIRNAHVLSLDPTVGDLPRGDIVVEDGRIARIGCGRGTRGRSTHPG